MREATRLLDNNTCVVCGEKYYKFPKCVIVGLVDVHHTDGRNGDLTFDVTKAGTVCNHKTKKKCHNEAGRHQFVNDIAKTTINKRNRLYGLDKPFLVKTEEDLERIKQIIKKKIGEVSGKSISK